MSYFSEYVKASTQIAAADFAAEAITGAISASIEKKDRQDLLKTLVFVTSYKATLTRDLKKHIVTIMKIIDEDISVFSCEPEIDGIYRDLQKMTSAAFFKEVLSTRILREKIMQMYIYVLFLVSRLNGDKTLSPQQLYNLSLIKKQFQFSRQELGQCYSALAKLTETDTDDIAEELEMLTGESAMRQLMKDYPDLVEGDAVPHIGQDAESAGLSEETLQAIESLYHESVQRVSEKDYETRLVLGQQRPQLLQKAINTYANEAAKEMPLVQFDESLMNNGQAGILLTNKKIYLKDTFEFAAIPIRNIVTVEATGTTIKVNTVSLQLISISKKAVQEMAEFLRQCVSVLESVHRDNAAEADGGKLAEIEKLYYESVKRSGNASYASLVLLADLKPDYVRRAISVYAKVNVGENAILLFDGFGDKGNNGFLLSNRKIYIKNGTIFSKPVSISLKDIKAVSVDPKKLQIMVNDAKIEAAWLQKSNAVEELALLMQQIIPLAMEV